MKKVVYVAGGMTGLPHHNFPAFFSAERRLRKMGYRVVNPARMDVEAGELTADGEVLKRVAARDIAKRDLLALIEKCDGIVLLPGWKHSKGARAERALAEWLGMTVLSYKSLCARAGRKVK